MKRIVDVDMSMNCKKFSTALKRFFNTFPEQKEEWKETFEYMYENDVDFFCDDTMGDGTRNDEWRYALHLDHDEEHYYMALIVRN